MLSHPVCSITFSYYEKLKTTGDRPGFCLPWAALTWGCRPSALLQIELPVWASGGHRLLSEPGGWTQGNLALVLAPPVSLKAPLCGNTRRREEP